MMTAMFKWAIGLFLLAWFIVGCGSESRSIREPESAEDSSLKSDSGSETKSDSESIASDDSNADSESIPDSETASDTNIEPQIPDTDTVDTTRTPTWDTEPLPEYDTLYPGPCEEFQINENGEIIHTVFDVDDLIDEDTDSATSVLSDGIQFSDFYPSSASLTEQFSGNYVELYDTNNRIVYSAIQLDSENIDTSWAYHFHDAQGRPIRVIFFQIPTSNANPLSAVRDGEGRISSVSVLWEGNSVPVIELEYNSDGRIGHITTYSGEEVDRTVAFEYNSAGLLTRLQDDKISTGGINSYLLSATYDPAGRVTRLERDLNMSYMEETQVENSVIEFTYNDHGDLILVTGITLPRGAIEVIEGMGPYQVYTYQYDDAINENHTEFLTAARLILGGYTGEDSDWWMSGVAATWLIPHASVRSISLDMYGDGSIEQTYTVNQDNLGRVSRIVLDVMDPVHPSYGSQGNYTRQFQYDGDVRYLSNMSWFRNVDGVLESNSTTYDVNGWVLSHNWRTDERSTVVDIDETTTTNSYDNTGRLIETVSVYQGEFCYLDDCHVTGKNEHITTTAFTYDTPGNLVGKDISTLYSSYEYLEDKVPVESTTSSRFLYDCW